MRNCVQWIEISFIDCVPICGDGEFLDNGLACRAEIDEIRLYCEIRLVKYRLLFNWRYEVVFILLIQDFS